MNDTYRSLFRLPGAVALVGAGVPARLPIATYAIGFLAVGRDAYGSFAVGGAMAAGYTAATIASGPVICRWASAGWFSRALALLTVAQLTAVLTVLLTIDESLSPAISCLLAGLVGLLQPPAGAISRARWSTVVGGSDQIGRALFLESALDEAVFLVGPLLITTMGTVVGPRVALAAAAVVTVRFPPASGPGVRRFRAGSAAPVDR